VEWLFVVNAAGGESGHLCFGNQLHAIDISSMENISYSHLDDLYSHHVESIYSSSSMDLT
jgi:hypothetical protein